jgi:hypothetical protein
LSSIWVRWWPSGETIVFGHRPTFHVEDGSFQFGSQGAGFATFSSG